MAGNRASNLDKTYNEGRHSFGVFVVVIANQTFGSSGIKP